MKDRPFTDDVDPASRELLPSNDQKVEQIIMWRPISNPPKIGDWVLLLGVLRCKTHILSAFWGEDIDWEPTHWIPFPKMDENKT